MKVTDGLVLVADFENTPQVPANFRTSQDAYPPEAAASVIRRGLDRLNASAARQFSELDLISSLDRMSGQVYIVDLRQESHAFADGRPVCWYGLRNQANVARTAREIMELEEELASQLVGGVELNDIVQKTSGRIEQTHSYRVEVQRGETEQQRVERRGLNYVRLPVTDHQHPHADTVDQFVDFVSSLPEDAWVHFHCRSGKGRSSTFMVLYDIFRNARDVSLEDIIQRNFLLGSKDVSRISDLPAKVWKNDMARDRHHFVADFYSYMVDPGGYGHLRWSEWAAQRDQARAGG